MERQVGLDAVLVGLVDKLHLGKLTHLLAVLLAGQVAAARVGREDLSRGGDFKPLRNGFLGFTAGNGFGHTIIGYRSKQALTQLESRQELRNHVTPPPGRVHPRERTYAPFFERAVVIASN